MANPELNQQLNDAVKKGELGAVQKLLRDGADPNNDGHPLHLACMTTASAKVAMLKVLLDAGAKVDATNQYDRPVLFELIRHDHASAEAAQVLLDAGFDLHHKSAVYGTALAWAAEHGRESIIEVLLKRGATVQAEKGERSPLERAFGRGQYGAARLLIAFGADPDVCFSSGSTPLGSAIFAGDHALFETVLERRKPTAIDPEMLVRAALCGEVAMVARLVELGVHVDATSSYGRPTALSTAAERGKLAVVKYLLEKGADREARDSAGNTALMGAAAHGHVEVLRCLVAAGADLHAKNPCQVNALMHACLAGHLEAAKFLIESGAPLDDIESENGTTALTMAKSVQSAPLVHLLTEHGARERDIRRPKPGEDYFSIIDCDICFYLPQKKRLSDREQPDELPLLNRVHTDFSYPDRYSTRTHIIHRCPVCGTYYHQHHYIDTEDAFATPPTMDLDLQRYNLLGLRETLKTVGKTQELAEFERRYPTLIAQYGAALKGNTRTIRSNILIHLIESVVDDLIARADWNQLEASLLNHADPHVVLATADNLISIHAQSSQRGTYPFSGERRDTTPTQKEQLQRWLPANRALLAEYLLTLPDSHDLVLKRGVKEVFLVGTYTGLFPARPAKH